MIRINILVKIKIQGGSTKPLSRDIEVEKAQVGLAVSSVISQNSEPHI